MEKEKQKNYGLSDEDWQRFTWVAEKAFCVVPGSWNPGSTAVAMAATWENPLSPETQLKLTTELAKIHAGLNGSLGDVVIKIGFPSVQGLVCRVGIKLVNLSPSMAMGGLVQWHPVNDLLKEKDVTKDETMTVDVQTGSIHLGLDFIKDADVDELGSAIIHEAGHKYARLGDKFYLSKILLDPTSSRGGIRRCLDNADSYAMFCMVVTGRWEEWLRGGWSPGGYRGLSKVKNTGWLGLFV
jgi:hypothetical protein